MNAFDLVIHYYPLTYYTILVNEKYNYIVTFDGKTK